MINKQKLKSKNRNKLKLPVYFEKSQIKTLSCFFGTKKHKKQSFFLTITKVFSNESPVHEKPLESNLFLNVCFDKTVLKVIITWFLEKYGEKITIDLVETLKQIGFHQATCAGVSLGVDDLKIPQKKSLLVSQASAQMINVTHALQAGSLTSVEKSQRLIDTWNQTSEILRETAVFNFRTTNPVNPVYMMAFSGARGNMSQVRQLVAMRGLMADPQGTILEFPIQSNFREGLTVTEYLISCYGARKGLVDTALRTATSGYLTRRLVVAVQHVVIHVTNCQTKKGLILRHKNIEQKLIGRVLLQDTTLNSQKIIKKDTLISPSLAKQLARQYQEVAVRSPLTCQTEKSVCQFCFGVDLAKGKLVSLGEAVGVIAAQSIGEPGTQLTMRTFHTGGVGVFSDQAMKSFIAPFSGKVYFFESLAGIFVRTPHGKSVYLLKHKTIEKNKTFLKLIKTDSIEFSNSSFFDKSAYYEIKHQDVPSGSILWVKQGEFVKRGQVLLQASRLETSKQEMPESSHPVQAPFSGEIIFQHIKTQNVEQEKTNSKNKKLNKKEITPQFLTLTELGSFWVFSCFIQKQNQIATQFFVPGDFLSPKTPIQQYNLQVPYQGQLKIVNSDIILAQNLIEFLFSRIFYSKNSYFIYENQNLIVYKESSTFTRLTYYPFFKRNKLYSNFGKKDLKKIQGFHIQLDFGQNCVKDQTEIVPEKLNLNTNSVSNKICLMSPHQIWHLKSSANLLYNKFFPNYSFIIATHNTFFSKKGFFQLKYAQQKVWSKKNLVKKIFLANFQAQFFKIKPTYSFNKKTEFFSKPSKSKTQNYLKKTKFFQVFSVKSSFIEKALKNSHQKIHYQADTTIIQKNHVWIYVSTSSSSFPQFSGVVLQPGKPFDNLVFPHCFISINILYKKKISFLQAKFQQHFFFYSLTEILFKKKKFTYNFIKKSNKISKNFSNSNFQKDTISRQNWSKKKTTSFSNKFCFYKKQHSNEKPNVLAKTFGFTKLNYQQAKKQKVVFFILLEKSFIEFFPTKKMVYETCFLKHQFLCNQKNKSCLTVKSPLFSKQVKTSLQQSQIPKPKIQFIPVFSQWCSPATYFKFFIDFQIFKTFGKLEEFQQKIIVQQKFNKKKENTYLSDSVFLTGLSIKFYKKILFNNPYNFCFQTFQNDFVLPHFSISGAFFKSKSLGEFRRFQNKQKKVSLSILRNQDQVTLILPTSFSSLQKINFSEESQSFQKIGARIRWSQEIFPGFASSLSGQILKFTPNKITLRKGVPFLASIRGLLHIRENDLIQKNDLLMTLRSRRLETEDIVQGIPKIEQLFEARETHSGKIIENNMHMLLKQFFSLACRVRPLSEAVELSLIYIQKYLIKNIVQAYSNQGVYIAEKHVEVVVRQMTARVRIIHGGESNYLPGELVQLRHIEKLNYQLSIRKYRQVTYEPVILGITKSALQSESFLLAASFQQVSKVLVKSALAKKTDFLRGLHENILVGQPIPAGTGIIDIFEE